MSCKVCGRGGCVASFHSLAEQEAAELTLREARDGWREQYEAAVAYKARAEAAEDVLAQIEWSGWQDFVGDGGYRCCPCCEGIAPEDAEKPDALLDLRRASFPNVVGHKEGCALARARKAAGGSR